MSDEVLPIQFSFLVNKDGRILKFNKSVQLQPSWDVQADCFSIHDEEALGMPIDASGDSVKDLIEDLTNTIFLNWDEYALSSFPRGLKNGQRIWRTELLERISEPENQDYLHASKVVVLPEEGNWATESINESERQTGMNLWKLFYGEHFSDESPKELL